LELFVLLNPPMPLPKLSPGSATAQFSSSIN